MGFALQSAPGFPCALYSRRHHELAALGRKRAARTIALTLTLFEIRIRTFSPSLRGAKRTKQSSFPCCRQAGLLRFARNDGGEAWNVIACPWAAWAAAPEEAAAL